MRGPLSTWNNLQQMSKAALLALVAILGVVAAMAATGDAPSVGVVAGFVAGAAALIVYTEYVAAKEQDKD